MPTRELAAKYPAQAFGGSELLCGAVVKVEVLAARLNAPEKKPTGPQKNNASIVLRLERLRFGMLLSGDASEEAEKWMLDPHGAALRSNALKLGRHGSATSTSEDWVAAVRPGHIGDHEREAIMQAFIRSAEAWPLFPCENDPPLF